MRLAPLTPRSVRGDTLAAIPFCQLTQAATNIANASFAVPNLTSTTYDNGVSTTGDALADLTNDRILLRRVGLWMIDGYVTWAANANGYRTITIRANGANLGYAVNTNFGGIFGTEMSISSLFYATAVTDYADVLGYQNTGGNLSATFTLKAAWLGSFG